MHRSLYKKASDTDRAYSPGVWADCTVLDYILRGTGHVLEERFLLPASVAASGAWQGQMPWEIYSSAAGPTLTAVDGGGLTISSDDDNEQVAFSSLNGAPFLIAAGEGRLWFEARIKVSTIANTKFGFFIGLAEAGAAAANQPLAADGTLADINLVGFHHLEADGDMLDTVYKADGQVAQTKQADAITLVADTYIKPAMYFDGTILRFFSNGVELSGNVTAAQIAAATFPNDKYLAPCFGISNAAGGSPGTATIERIRVVQELL
mgnify:CR=1 FL=1